MGGRKLSNEAAALELVMLAVCCHARSRRRLLKGVFGGNVHRTDACNVAPVYRIVLTPVMSQTYNRIAVVHSAFKTSFMGFCNMRGSPFIAQPRKRAESSVRLHTQRPDCHCYLPSLSNEAITDLASINLLFCAVLLQRRPFCMFSGNGEGSVERNSNSNSNSSV